MMRRSRRGMVVVVLVELASVVVDAEVVEIRSNDEDGCGG